MARDWMSAEERRKADAEEKWTRLEALSVALLLLIPVLVAIKVAFL